MARTRILFVGVDPARIDYQNPDQALPDMTAEKIQATIDGAVSQLRSAEYDVDLCLIGYDGAVAEATVRDQLAAGPFDGIVIGAGVRLFAKQTELFERLVNAVHDAAPTAKFVFNTTPTDTAEAVRRWFPQSEKSAR